MGLPATTTTKEDGGFLPSESVIVSASTIGFFSNLGNIAAHEVETSKTRSFFFQYCTSCVHNKGCIVLDLDIEPEKYREAQFLQVLQALPIRHLFVRLE